MFIELKDLEIHPVDFREEFGPGVIDLGAEVRQRSPLRSEGRADLVEEHHGKHKVVQDIRVKGKLETSLEVAVRAVSIHRLSSAVILNGALAGVRSRAAVQKIEAAPTTGSRQRAQATSRLVSSLPFTRMSCTTLCLP